jgi:6-phosphogluconolactonase
MEVEVLDDPAARAAELIVAAAGAGGHLALSGGSTPRAAYERAAGMDCDWSAATLWLGDDRCVPPDDERSNWRLLQETLLARIEGDAPAAERIEGELEVGEAADRYDGRLRERDVTFDLQLLGIGPDGHTASLFPGKPALDERERMAVAVPEAGMDPYVPRVSLTLPAINASRSIVFLVKGEDKVDAVRRAFGSGPDAATPASLVERSAMTLLIDPAAAEGLG